jgi:Xaa-Pro aminopeptidase
MVVTIEPGIYLPNIGGVRLEDMVLITQENARVLTHIRKDILTA